MLPSLVPSWSRDAAGPDSLISIGGAPSGTVVIIIIIIVLLIISSINIYIVIIIIIIIIIINEFWDYSEMKVQSNGHMMNGGDET